MYIHWYITKFKYKVFLLFSHETFFSPKILNLVKTLWALQILSQASSLNFRMKKLWALENHVLVNMLLCSSHLSTGEPCTCEYVTLLQSFDYCKIMYLWICYFAPVIWALDNHVLVNMLLWPSHLSTREPFSCEYVTLLQSFHRYTLSLHWYIAQNFLFLLISGNLRLKQDLLKWTVSEIIKSKKF